MVKKVLDWDSISSLDDGNGDGFREVLVGVLRTNNPVGDIYKALEVFMYLMVV